MFTIKEASEQLGVPAHTIRYYEKEGLLPNIQRDENGNRFFAQEDLDWMSIMTCFRVTGMPISKLRNIVSLALEGDDTIEDRMRILQDHRLKLEKQQEELKQAFDAVDHKLKRYKRILEGSIAPSEEFLMSSDPK